MAVKCRFFHFVKNARKNASATITAVKKATGKRSGKRWLAEKTKRRLMMLPLLPEELIRPDVVGLIHQAWTERAPKGLKNIFDDLITKLLETYVGAPAEFQVHHRFPTSLWCIGGRRVRTNNPAENCHRQLNAEVSGTLSLFQFLAIIEGQMAKSERRIDGGCHSESHAVEGAKNRMLAQDSGEMTE